MSTPRATARLQLHAGFTFDDARAQIPYYAKLGISHFYLSPISCARPGSTHGYDVVDHRIVNPELGGESAFARLARDLQDHAMGIILDIVPNHMATHSDNHWWWDVLRHGQGSAYADWFDIDWNSPDHELRGKVLAPFLAESYGQSLIDGRIKLIFDEASQTFQIQACDARYPLAPGTLDKDTKSISRTLARYDAADAVGRERLHQLLQQQHYVLSWWRCAADRINWRRFFEVTDLIGLCVERRQVFEAVHALPLRLFAEGFIDGVRVDHVDGLAQPLAYCRQLRTELEARSARREPASRNDEPWLIVEKILASGETLDQRWAADGTSGYDFMDQASAVLHDPAGESDLTARWIDVCGDPSSLRTIVQDARRLMLHGHFAAERRALLNAFTLLAQSDMATRDWTGQAIARVLDALLILFPVYRTYIEGNAADASDAELLRRVADEARRCLSRDGGSNDVALLDVVGGWLAGDLKTSLAVAGCATFPGVQQKAVRRFQQLTPPLAAKSLEDTVFYRYGRLLSRNEVGSDPAVFAMSPEHFHRRMMWRGTRAPHAMLATATHDQKRGEDVRARLAVLSEIPTAWIEASQRWLQWPNGGTPAKSGVQAAERYMLFQTLTGAWPLDLTLEDDIGLGAYAERVVQWQIKALREAKVSSGWFEPALGYEQSCANYVRELLQGQKCGLLSELYQFVQKIAPAGAVNSLAQTALRVTAPGVPDLYQGTEFWDLSLVDPDNRRPVDFVARGTALDSVDARSGIQSLLTDWRKGHIKQAVLSRSLRLRHEMPEVFINGRYFELPIAGPKNDHALAFLRTFGRQAILVVVPRLCSQAVGAGKANGLPLICPEFWEHTYISLPQWAAGIRWCDALTKVSHQSGYDRKLFLAEALAELPVAVMVAEGPLHFSTE
jgi:(1->4)-alpha-D-glucan 1-alpha-D-glucosylmutase